MKPSKSTSLKQLEWSFLASRDREEIFSYIAIHDLSPLNAVLVDSRILDAALTLRQYPLAGTKKKTKYLMRVKNTQYTIVYMVLSKTVRILRIVHQKRKNI